MDIKLLPLKDFDVDKFELSPHLALGKCHFATLQPAKAHWKQTQRNNVKKMTERQV